MLQGKPYDSHPWRVDHILHCEVSNPSLFLEGIGAIFMASVCERFMKTRHGKNETVWITRCVKVPIVEMMRGIRFRSPSTTLRILKPAPHSIFTNRQRKPFSSLSHLRRVSWDSGQRFLTLEKYSDCVRRSWQLTQKEAPSPFQISRIKSSAR